MSYDHMTCDYDIYDIILTSNSKLKNKKINGNKDKNKDKIETKFTIFNSDREYLNKFQNWSSSGNLTKSTELVAVFEVCI